MTKKVDLDVRSKRFFQNYDYGGPEEGDSGPGRGLYSGRMDKYKSVKEFIEKSRARQKKRRKDALAFVLAQLGIYEQENS